MHALIVYSPCTSVLERNTRLLALMRSRKRRFASTSPSRRRNGTTVSCGAHGSSSSGIAFNPSYKTCVRSSFSSSASRNAETPCSLSGSQTRRPRHSRESSAEYSL